MKALVIYDTTGRIYTILYGEDEAPQGIPCLAVDIPAGAQLDRVDITDPVNPKPVFSKLQDTDIGTLQKQVGSLTNELVSTQMALTEIFEMMLGGGM